MAKNVTGLTVLLMIALTLSPASAVLANWTAYNDCIWQSPQPIGNNVTTYGIGNGYSGPTNGTLKNQATGANTGVTVSITQSGGMGWLADTSMDGPSECNPGTDAYNTFHGFVNLGGVIYGPSGNWWVDVTFSGLNPYASYEFAATSQLGPSLYAGRLSRYTISGADSFTNSSTPGTTIGSNGAYTTFSAGYNVENGYVARWTGIAAGADGVFKVRMEKDPLTSTSYALDGFMLRETSSVPEPNGLLILGVGIVPLFFRRLRR